MKKLLILIGVLILVLGAGATYWYFSTKESRQISSIETSYEAGNLDAAIGLAEKGLAENPNNVEALLALAASYAQRGSLTFNEESNALKAIEYANKALQIDPNNSEAYRIIGYANEIQEKYEEAIKNYDKAIALNPNNSQAYSNKGHSYDLQGNMEMAAELYDKALKIDPGNQHALINMARVYLRKGDDDNALIMAENVVSISKDKRLVAEAKLLQAIVWFNEKQFESVEVLLEEIVVLDPTMPQAWALSAENELALAVYVEDPLPEDDFVNDARKFAKKAIELNPNQATAYYVLYKIALFEGNKAEIADMKSKTLQAIELDITLGAKEKEIMRNALNVTVKNVKTI